MKTARTIAVVLFILSRIAAILYSLTAVYAGLVLLGERITKATWLPMSTGADGRFTIYYPFTRTPFLLGDNTGYFFSIMLLTLLFYGVFFWLLSDIFNVFRKPRLFTVPAVKSLNRFYPYNFTFPVLILLLVIISGEELSGFLIIAVLHIVLGVFAYFMAAIFKQGLLLQEEQDQTL